MNEANKGKVIYRGNRRGFERFLEGLGRRTDTTPLVVEDNITTGIVPYEPPVTAPLYASPLTQPVAVQTVPAYGTKTSRPRQHGRNPQSLGEWLLVVYATPFALWDRAWNGAKG